MNLHRRLFMPILAATPPFLWQLYFLFLPLLFILFHSISAPEGGVTTAHYAALATYTFFAVVAKSLMLAISTAVVALVIAFPVAYSLATATHRYKNVLLMLLILPSWTSFIVQAYSWYFVLQRNGLLSTLLVTLGITSEPLSFLNCPGAVILGMVYCYLPFMIFPLYTVLERMDKKLLEASADLGANKLQTFYRIILPLALPGIKIGMFLVMVPAFSEFAIPDLMGGFKGMYLGRMVMEKFILYRNWGSGAAAALVSIVFPLVLIGSMLGVRVLMRRALGREEGGV